MIHSREEVIQRTIQEFELLDDLVAHLTDEQWARLVPRPESRDPWTIKDALAHITYWKANTVRSIQKKRRPPEQQGLDTNAANHLIFITWRDRSPQEVLAWHRQVQQELIAALQEVPDEWYSKREHTPPWPYDLDGHSGYHRLRDIGRALAENPA